MKQYTAGELAQLAGVSSRTIRYYDQRGLLTPEGYSDSGYRLYGNEALVRMQQIIMLKFAGFSLEEIRSVLLMGQGQDLRETLEDQRQLLQQRIGQLEEIVMLLEDVMQEDDMDLEALAQSMRLTQRINHSVRTYQRCVSHGQRSLYPWEFDRMNLQPGQRVLDVGCGVGMIWRHSWRRIPEHTEIHMLDVHPKCIRELKRFYGEQKDNLQPGVSFRFRQEDVETAALAGPYDHILMAYLWNDLRDPAALLQRLYGALRPGGTLYVIQGTGLVLEDMDEIFHAFSGESCLTERKQQVICRNREIEDTLRGQFLTVEQMPFDDELHFTRPLDLYCFLMDSYQELVQGIEKQGGKFVSFLRRYVEERGTVTLHSRAMLYRCRREERE